MTSDIAIQFYVIISSMQKKNLEAQDLVHYIKATWYPTDHRRTMVMQSHHFKNDLILAHMCGPNT